MPPATQTLTIEKKSPPKRWLNAAFKVLIVLLPAIAIYFELSGRNNLGELLALFFQQLNGANLWWLGVAILLIPLNWFAEVQKWRPFIVQLEPMSHWKAANAILAGSSFAIFTPNRVGEYGGRILFVRPENQWKALFANAVGSFSQYIVLLSGGIIGGAWLAAELLHWNIERQTTFIALALLLLAALYFYFNIGLVVPLARRLPFLQRFESYVANVHFLEKISRAELAKVLAWSVFRYAVYATQYFLLLQFFGIKTGFTAGYAGIAAIFFFQTVVPLPALAGLLVRGSLAVFVWSHFGANDVSSLAATFVLWIINLILPALIGTFSLISVNITKSLGYEDD